MLYNEVVTLIAVALCINIYLAIYLLFCLNKTKKVIIFSLFLLSLIVWQINDLAIRLSETYNTAVLWNETLGAISGSMTTFSYHFALAYSGRIRKYFNIVSLWLIYPITIAFIVLLISPIANFEIVHSELLGRIGATGESYIAILFSSWVSLLAVLTLLILLRQPSQMLTREKRTQAKLIAIGYTIPAIQGILLEFVIPVIFPVPPVSITSATCTIFSITVIIALKKYGLFEVSGSQLWRNVAGNMGEGVVISNPQGIIRYFNDKFKQVSGYSETEIEGRNISELLVDNDTILKNGENNEVRLLSKDGTLIWTFIKTNKFIDMFGKDNGLIHIFMDISERKSAKEALRESEEKFSLLIQTLKDAVLITDKTGQIVFSNLAAQKLFCSSEIQLENHLVTDLIMPYMTSKSISFTELMDTLDAENLTIEMQGMCAGGKHFQSEISFTRWFNKGKEFHCFLIRDITERRTAELKIRDTISETQEQERARIARELHDGIGQILIGTKLHASALLEQVQFNKDAFKMIMQIQEMLDHSIKEVRNISHNLMPVEVKNLGFSQAIKSLCGRMALASRITISLDINYPEKSLGISMEIHIFRVIQEFISNTIKYAEAKNIFIGINYLNHSLIIDLSDDGKGVNLEEKLKNGKGLGIRNIFNRIKFLNGTLIQKQRQDNGLSLLISIPLKADQ